MAPEIEHLEEYTVLDLLRRFDVEKIVVYSLGLCILRLYLLIEEEEFTVIMSKKDGLKGLIKRIENLQIREIIENMTSTNVGLRWDYDQTKEGLIREVKESDLDILS